MAVDRTERLIDDLAAGLVSVARLPSLAMQTAAWLTVAVSVGAASVWILGARGDLAGALSRADVILPLVLAATGSLASAVVALRLSVPGAPGNRWTRWAAVALGAIWMAALWMSRSTALPAATAWSEPLHAACVIRVALISIVPAAMLLRSVRRGFPLDPAWSMGLAAWGACVAAAVAVQFVCPIDRPAHILWSHAGPAVAIGAVIAACATWLRPGRFPGSPVAHAGAKRS